MRRRAAHAVGRVGLAEGVAPLAAVLAGDRDAEVRQMAAFALGLIGHRSAVEPLRAALGDPSALVRGRAAEALGLIGDTASAQAIASMAAAHLPAVLAASLDADEGASPVEPAAEAFRLGVYALTRLKAADALMGVVLDPAGQPRLAWWPVAYALSRIEDPRAVPALVTLLRSGGSVTRAFAARGLGARNATASAGALVPLAQAWRTDPRVAVSAIRALAQMGAAEAAAPLRALVQDREVDANVRLEAVTALGALKDHEALGLVLDAVTDPWPAMRAAGLRALKNIDLDTFVIVLSGLDADAHPSVRTATVSLLPALGPSRAAPRLSAMMDGQDPAVAAAAIEAMAGLPETPKDFASTLQRLLAGGDVMVRAAAASALGGLKPAGGDLALAAAYRAGAADELYQARAAALTALAKYGAAAAVPTLEEALADRDWAVRLRAAALLRELDPAADAVRPIRPAPWTRRRGLRRAGPGRAARSPRTCSSTPTRAPSRSNSPCSTRRSPPRTSWRWPGAGSSAGWPSTASCRTSSSRTAIRAATAKAGRATRIRDELNMLPVPARHGRHGARLAPTPAAASSSSRTRRSRTSTAATRSSGASSPAWTSWIACSSGMSSAASACGTASNSSCGRGAEAGPGTKKTGVTSPPSSAHRSLALLRSLLRRLLHSLLRHSSSSECSCSAGYRRRTITSSGLSEPGSYKL